MCVYIGSFSSLWPICPVFNTSSPWGCSLHRQPLLFFQSFFMRIRGNAHVCDIFLPTQKLASYMHSLEIRHCRDDRSWHCFHVGLWQLPCDGCVVLQLCARLQPHWGGGITVLRLCLLPDPSLPLPAVYPPAQELGSQTKLPVCSKRRGRGL